VTIGIAVSGPGAARAALAALAAVEAVGRGAIGGFVSLVAIAPDGTLLSAGTQRGGSAALFPAGWPEGLADARLAALMSSGPDRPEPLSQFTPADPAAGLVTGHRLPNMPAASGAPPNRTALRALADGMSPEDAVAAALDPEPEFDAGLIAMDLSGRIALADTKAVATRDDAGAGLASDKATGLRIGVLHNSIHPHRPLADLVLAAALDSVAPADRCDATAEVTGLAVRDGPPGRRLVLDPETGMPAAFEAADPSWRADWWEGSPVRRGDPVLSGGLRVGRVTRESYCILADGVITSARGGDTVGWVWTGAA
jgi:hypothetical protein